MATQTNKACIIPSKDSYPLEIRECPMPSPPKENQLTIRVHAVAINPVDMAMQAMGIAVFKYPCIPGHDAAGIVTAIGPKVTKFKVGDRVTGCVDEDEQKEGQGAFQLYVNLHETLTGLVPEGTSLAQASVLPLAMDTACTGLFEERTLGLDLPHVNPPKGNKNAILVWGGSSSVGTSGIQAAKSAGYEVAATAGGHNLEYLKTIGADQVFDHSSESVVEDVVKSLKGKEFCGAFAAIMSDEAYEKCARVCMGLGGVQIVSTVVPPMMPYEKELPGGVKFAYNWGAWLRDTHVGPAIWHDWVPGALANGTLKCKPGPDIVGQGLEKVQEALDLMKQKPSAKKYVVEIP